MYNAIGTLVTAKIQLLHFNTLPKQNFKEIFSKLTHLPKCQNDVWHDNANMECLPYSCISLYCKAKLGGVGYHESSMRESVSQIEKQLWHKLRNKLTVNSVSITILEVLQTRSRISMPTLKILTRIERLHARVYLIRCQQKIQCCYS